MAASADNLKISGLKFSVTDPFDHAQGGVVLRASDVSPTNTTPTILPERMTNVRT
jgi:hypothetical protein